MTHYITTSEAAEIIGCVDSRVRQLLRKAVLAGRRMGRDWMVDKASAERYAAAERKPGPKPKAEKPAPKRRRKSP